jgi:hypothetical protein
LEISSKPEEITTETPIENDTTPPTDNTETIEAPTQDTTNTEVNSENNIVSAVESGTTETNTQATEVQAQKIEEAPSLSKDMDIIKNIQNTNTVVQASTPSNPTISSTPNTIDTMPKIPANNSFNLDSLQVQIPQIPQSTTTVIPPAPSPIPANPYDNLQKIIPQIAPTTNIPATNNNTMKIASTIGTIVFILLVRFVTKTMYPLQYKDFINNITGGENEETISIALLIISP